MLDLLEAFLGLILDRDGAVLANALDALKTAPLGRVGLARGDDLAVSSLQVEPEAALRLLNLELTHYVPLSFSRVRAPSVGMTLRVQSVDYDFNLVLIIPPFESIDSRNAHGFSLIFFCFPSFSVIEKPASGIHATSQVRYTGLKEKTCGN